MKIQNWRKRNNSSWALLSTNQLRSLILIYALFQAVSAYAQPSGSIFVGGDNDKFYPVTWVDGNFILNKPTHLSIGRSDTHINGSWHGSLISHFTFHTSQWGNGSQFIDAEIHSQYNSFIGGWRDATSNNGIARIIIWLRGATTYYYHSDVSVDPIVYDNQQNGLPYKEENGPEHSYKTNVDYDVNEGGRTEAGNIYVLGGGNSYFAGNIRLGTLKGQGYKLAVGGSILAESVKVTPLQNWPDYVFSQDFRPTPLTELAAYIKEHRHLPEIPTADSVAKTGTDLGEISIKLLKKIES